MLDPKTILNLYPNRSYVYVCYLHGQPVYIGKGKHKRYLHCTSGKSTNQKLNEAFSIYGVEALEVRMPYYDLDYFDAPVIERRLINSYLAEGWELYNRDVKTLLNPPPSYITIPRVDFESLPEPDWVTEDIEPFATEFNFYLAKIY